MGLLTTEQKAAIKSGTVRVKQEWFFCQPPTKGDQPTSSQLIHDGLTVKRVMDAGSREIEAYNQTVVLEGELRINNYQFTLNNYDGLFTLDRPGSIWDRGSGWVTEPVECAIRHKVFLLVNGVWEELSFLQFFGAIIGVAYKSTGTSKGGTVNNEAIITCNNDVITKMMSRDWTHDDGTETDCSYTFQGEAT